ncbi:hypothetical protein L1987_47951 [Smallanthus sonchifolius]|uniref:Uncharacterized protein n=1 Tax=Smallanthus sonchifolius TaxID=185202 RepID=A0ACB9FQ00_9ASTR|nr:hypothetical protein L1987_47951 [Smallanthus sonchifolius]
MLELSKLSNLKKLDLSLNNLNITPSMKGCKSLTRLERLESVSLGVIQQALNWLPSFEWTILHLYLDDNNFLFVDDIMRSMAAFPSLRYLSLDDSFNKGGRLFANEVPDLPYLEVLALRNNYLNGTLPMEAFTSFHHLKVLDLSYNNFVGSIPSTIKLLSSLKVISFDRNALNGSLPEDHGICELKNLYDMDLSNNMFDGNLPECFNRLSSLKLFDISSNQFTGIVAPSLIANLTSLEFVDFSQNKFEGSFSFSLFSNHTKLKFFQFERDNEKFEVETEEPTGWIPLFQLKYLLLSNWNIKTAKGSVVPSFLLHQHELRTLDLAHNSLEGQFPNWLLKNNKKLNRLVLRNNSFEGVIRNALYKNASIRWLDMSKNHMTGTIPEDIQKFIPNIEVLNFSSNALNCVIPFSIRDLRELSTLDLSDNKLSGEVPKAFFANLSWFEVIKLSNNRLSGCVLSGNLSFSIQVLQLDNNNFTGDIGNNTNKDWHRTVLDISNNHFTGKIPNWIINMGLDVELVVRNNNFEGEFPCGTTSFSFLDISHNSFSGSIPSCLSLQDTKHLHLGYNKFTGMIPDAFRNLSQVLTLDIEHNYLPGRIPKFIGELSNLRILKLRENNFSGSIPKKLCQLNNASFIDLSSNSLSGSIPRCLKDITGPKTLAFIQEPLINYAHPYLTYFTYGSVIQYTYNIRYSDLVETRDEAPFTTKSSSRTYKGNILDYISGLDLSCNKLTGEIPEELGMLTHILFLNLSHNRLTGPIPVSFSNLAKIESLDLSSNRLSGNVPSQLVKLTYLEVFNVSHNNLSGRLPEWKAQFATFTMESYEGNPLLCGLPLVNKCTTAPHVSDSSTKEGTHKWYDIDKASFYGSSGSTWFVFILGFAAVLYINPYWRRWWLDFVEECMYICYYFLYDFVRNLYMLFHEGLLKNWQERLMDTATQCALQAGTHVGVFKIGKEANEWTSTNFHPYLSSRTYLTCSLSDLFKASPPVSQNNASEKRQKDIKSCKSLTRLERLESVSLGVIQQALNWLPSFEWTILHLYLDDNNFLFVDDIMRSMAAFPSLRYLSLDDSFNKGGRLFANEVPDLPYLEVLALRNNYLNGTLPMEAFTSFHHLKVLDLSYNNFVGSIPSTIKLLSSLKVISFDRNALNGSLPEDHGICELKNLYDMDLSNNMFDGNLPECFNRLSSLKLFDISSNQFTGIVAPSLIANLTSLEFVDFSQNKFEGSFSFSLFSNHTKLKFFQFERDNEKFEVETEEPTGWIPLFQLKYLLLSNWNIKTAKGSVVPSFLLHQHELRTLDLAHNSLEGQFPNWLLKNNKKLNRLVLRNNSFEGVIRNALYKNASIRWLDMSKNHMTGTIPEDIQKFIPNIEVLNFSSNALNCVIPFSIRDLRELSTLDLSDNKLSGEVPKAFFANLSWFEVIKLSNNRLSGCVLSGNLSFSIQVLQLDNNNFTGDIGNNTNKDWHRTVLDISNNHFTGKIPNWIINMGLDVELVVRNNNFEGEFPCGTTSFSFLDISHNSFSGSIPSCLSLQDTKHLHLGYNKFTGMIPDAFRNLSQVLTLDIEHNYLPGRIPKFIGELSNLRILKLRENNFSGSIPKKLCQLNNASFIDLSSNSLSGSIPRCLKDITGPKTLAFIQEPLINYAHPYLTYFTYGSVIQYTYNIRYSDLVETRDEAPFTTKSSSRTYKGNILDYISGLDLSCNKLTGEIPEELGMLTHILFLNLSHNRLTGPIPVSFSNLAKIESLDLSSNRLSGNVPSQLVKLTYLEVFNVSHNNLSGRLPEWKAQFATFTMESYEGNPLLCGLPLVNKCTTAPHVSDSSTKEGTHKWYDIDKASFYGSSGSTWFVFILGFAAVLYINPYWRRWWLDFVEEYNDCVEGVLLQWVLMDTATQCALQAGTHVGVFKIGKEANEWTSTNFHPYLSSRTYLTCSLSAVDEKSTIETKSPSKLVKSKSTS